MMLAKIYTHEVHDELYKYLNDKYCDTWEVDTVLDWLLDNKYMNDELSVKYNEAKEDTSKEEVQKEPTRVQDQKTQQ